MPLFYTIEKGSRLKIFLWELLESQEEILGGLVLDRQEKERINTLGLKRKREFLGVRYVLNQVDPGARLSYDKRGKPYLVNRPQVQISLSHSGEKIAIALSKYPVGVDIESSRGDQLSRIKKKFLQETEIAFTKLEDENQKLQIIWGVKESLYKLSGGKFSVFFKNYRVLCFSETQKKIKCQIISLPIVSEFYAYYKIIGGYFLTYILDDGECK